MDRKAFSREAWKWTRAKADVAWIRDVLLSGIATTVVAWRLGTLDHLSLVGALVLVGASFAVFGSWEILLACYRRFVLAPPALLGEEVSRRMISEGERDRLARELASAQERLHPRFKLEITKFMVAPSQPALIDFAHDAVANLEIGLRNTGAQSFAGSWRCEVRHEGKVFVGENHLIPRGEAITLADESGRPRVRLSRGDFIPVKVADPILNGAQVVGWLLVTFAGISKDELTEASAEWTISCEDVEGTRWSATQHCGGSPDLLYIPGGVEPL